MLKFEAQVRGLVGASALFVTAVACNHFDHHTVVDLAMTSAYRPADVEFTDSKERGPGSADADEVAAHFQLLAGNFHCHVSPPDWNQEANPDLSETVVLARKEHLDFVVLTPHVRARFFLHESFRREELDALARLRDEIAKQGPGAPLLIVGFEYTDHRQGHLGFSFGDLMQLLARFSAQRLEERPQDFVNGWVASGGLVVVNHPLVTPLDSMFEIGRADLSWRPWTKAGPFPPEIEAANRLAQGFEAYNLTAAHARPLPQRPGPRHHPGHARAYRPGDPVPAAAIGADRRQRQPRGSPAGDHLLAGILAHAGGHPPGSPGGPRLRA